METSKIHYELPAGDSTSEFSEESTEKPIDLQALKALREEVGRSIDPETAEVIFSYCYTVDPYGEWADIPEEYQQVGRQYFARPPGGDTWVCFGDLPESTRDALREKLKDPGDGNPLNKSFIWSPPTDEEIERSIQSAVAMLIFRFTTVGEQRSLIQSLKNQIRIAEQALQRYEVELIRVSSPVT